MELIIILFRLIIIYTLRGFIVYITYNNIMPILILSLSQDPNKSEEKIRENFRILTYSESVLLVILTLSLVS